MQKANCQLLKAKCLTTNTDNAKCLTTNTVKKQS